MECSKQEWQEVKYKNHNPANMHLHSISESELLDVSLRVASSIPTPT